MVVGTVQVTGFPSKVVIGDPAKIRCRVTWNDASLLGEDMLLFVIDEDMPNDCLKGERWYTTTYGVPSRSGEKNLDITVTMPDKPLLRFYVELWTQVPNKYEGQCDIEEIT